VVTAAGHGTGQQGAGHAFADAALAGHHADDLFHTAVGVRGVVLGRCIAGRTCCSATGAVMGTFFAHSLFAHGGKKGPLPCASSLIVYGRGRPPPYYTIKMYGKQPAAPLCFCRAYPTRPFHMLEPEHSGQEVRHAAELFEECGTAHRSGCGAAAGRARPAHLAGKRAGRRGHGPVSAGSGGVFAVRHAGHGGCVGGGNAAHGGGAQHAGTQRQRPGDAAALAGGRAGAGVCGSCGTAGHGWPCGKMVAG